MDSYYHMQSFKVDNILKSIFELPNCSYALISNRKLQINNTVHITFKRCIKQNINHRGQFVKADNRQHIPA